MKVVASASVGAALLLSGCANDQSILAPRGPEAARIADLGWLLFLFGFAILCLVVVLLWLAMRGSEGIRAFLGTSSMVVGGGIVFPAVALSGLLGYGLWLTRASPALPGGTNAIEVDVVGEQWWWRVTYIDRAGMTTTTANEIGIPIGVPIEFKLRSADVIHSFWIPALGGKVDMIPGRTTQLRVMADSEGVFRGQCAEFCGGPHALMAIEVIAMSTAAFERWLEQQRASAIAAGTQIERRGGALFLAAGCGACHAIRGTEAAGVVGPDLTHVGSRRSIAAGTLPLSAANIGRFIDGGQHIKPGNRMPPFRLLASEDRDAIGIYLASLK